MIGEANVRFGRAWIVIFPALLGLLASDVRGQTVDDAAINSLVGTRYFEPIEQTSQGRLVGCGFEFKTVLRDHAYDRGKPVILIGSVSSFYFKGKAMNVSLKVRGNSLFFSQRLEPVFSPFEINYAYLKSAVYSSAGREATKFTCENGGFCAVYTEFQEIFEALVSNDLSLVYSRTPTGFDVVTKLDISTAENGVENLGKGLRCFARLVDRFAAQD